MTTYFRYLAFALILGVSASVAASTTALAGTIGLVKMVERNAFGTPPDRQREKKVIRFPVVQNELLETEAGAGMLIEFVDQTTLVLGANSSLVIDTFVYDPTDQSLTSVLNLSVGVLRYVSGTALNASMEIYTPTASIGIRGSDGLIEVAEDGATSVKVFSGTFTVRERGGGGKQAQVAAAQSVSVSATGSLGTVGIGPSEPTGGISAGGMPPAPGPSSGSDGKGKGGGDDELNQGLVDDDHDDDSDHHDDWDGVDEGDHHDDDDDFDSRGFGDDDGEGHDGDHGDHGDHGGGGHD